MRSSRFLEAENVDPEKFFWVVRDDGHSFKLFKRRYRLDVERFKFANQVCEKWSGLDEDVVAVGSCKLYLMFIGECI